MSFSRSILPLISCTLLTFAGCGRDDSSTQQPAPTPASTPATTQSIQQRIAELTGVTASTFPATLPATTQASTRPVRPQLDSTQTVAAVFDAMKHGDYAEMREYVLEAPLSDELHAQFARQAAAMASGQAKFEPVEEKVADPVAMVLIRATVAENKPVYTPLMLYRKQDRWLVMLAPPALKRYTSGERQRISELSDWAKNRLDVLQGNPSTTQSTTTPSTTQASK